MPITRSARSARRQTEAQHGRSTLETSYDKQSTSGIRRHYASDPIELDSESDLLQEGKRTSQPVQHIADTTTRDTQNGVKDGRWRALARYAKGAGRFITSTLSCETAPVTTRHRGDERLSLTIARRIDMLITRMFWITVTMFAIYLAYSHAKPPLRYYYTQLGCLLLSNQGYILAAGFALVASAAIDTAAKFVNRPVGVTLRVAAILYLLYIVSDSGALKPVFALITEWNARGRLEAGEHRYVTGRSFVVF